MKIFNKPELQIITFGEDIITTSGGLKSAKDNNDDNYQTDNLVFE